ncbi:MAG TPA: efflux RND transporter periplasmic adaptor subunit [Candidatus Binataceae bacterium]|nr:efflux RND transporter periplasmic adaptor subunit [Candidatus Binataceae bacterium]
MKAIKTPSSILLLAVVAMALSACGRDQKSASATQAQLVMVATPQRGTITRSLTLPGDLVGYYQSPLYAKVTGYVKSISVDKGDWVKAGQVLAEIEVPELQQRLERARADMDVQKVTYDRLETVWKSDPKLVARQDVDVAEGKYREAKAQADELSALMEYTHIVAPFDGVITGRFVDPGALTRSSGGAGQSADGGSSGQPNAILSEAMIDKLRVYVYAPQGVIGLIQRGMPAKLTVQDFPGRIFSGTVTRFANSLDLSTRTMLTEVDINNSQHQLYPGMYANVILQLENHLDAIQLRDSAIASAPDGSYVFVVRDGVLDRVPVTTGIRDGSSVEIVSGLKGGEAVVAALDPGLSAGEVVKPILERPTHNNSALAENH